jgi:hypothetical protein
MFVMRIVLIVGLIGIVFGSISFLGEVSEGGNVMVVTTQSTSPVKTSGSMTKGQMETPIIIFLFLTLCGVATIADKWKVFGIVFFSLAMGAALIFLVRDILVSPSRLQLCLSVSLGVSLLVYLGVCCINSITEWKAMKNDQKHKPNFVLSVIGVFALGMFFFLIGCKALFAPSYSGGWCAHLGIGLAWLVSLILFIIAFNLIRVRRRDRKLCQSFWELSPAEEELAADYGAHVVRWKRWRGATVMGGFVQASLDLRRRMERSNSQD